MMFHAILLWISKSYQISRPMFKCVKPGRKKHPCGQYQGQQNLAMSRQDLSHARGQVASKTHIRLINPHVCY